MIGKGTFKTDDLSISYFNSSAGHRGGTIHGEGEKSCRNEADCRSILEMAHDEDEITVRSKVLKFK